MSISAGVKTLLGRINLKKTPLPANTRLDLFFVWLMKNYRKDAVGEFCNIAVLDKITTSVMTNAARAKDSDSFKEDQTIPRVYYETCYSDRGPYYKEHSELKNKLRYVLNYVQQISVLVRSQSDNTPKPLYPKRVGQSRRSRQIPQTRAPIIPDSDEYGTENVTENVTKEISYPHEHAEHAERAEYPEYINNSDNMNTYYTYGVSNFY